MSAFFDTSVLLAATRMDDPNHDASFSALTAPHGATATGLHCFAEFYATTTALPRPWRRSPMDAMELIAGLRRKLEVVALDERDYLEVLDQVAALHLASGAIYDALIARCAVKWGASKLYTWNPKHFTRLGARVAKLVREPR
ncbi:MAG: PIN domain-containing protein [Bryobacteraceae bacterium]|nr:PIN domain-containing protein [Bryobacteraceae bacterium]